MELNLLVKRVFTQKNTVVLLFNKECQKFFNKKDSFNLDMWLEFSINSICINFSIKTVDKLKNVRF